MGDVIEFSPADVRLMQGLAAKVWRVRPELTNNECGVGVLAWIYGKDHAVQGDTWRRRFWYDGDDVVGWGWLYLPYKVMRSDGNYNEITHAYLAWQVHPDRPELLDDILDWGDARAGGVELRSVARAVDTDALVRLARHGYVLDEKTAAEDGYWLQMNVRDLTDIPGPVLPDGFRFRDAADVGPEAAVRAHRDAWHPSSFTDVGYAGVRSMWPYREDLHVLVEAPDGTMVASTIMWLDDANRVAEFEPVGTHPRYRRLRLGSALLYHGMHRARAAGAGTMIVNCLGGSAHPAARGLYYGVGFRQFTRDVPQVRRR
ncbi:MAG TPA: GNAT family N-acetyltransferase [Pseudonocardiaceae bacterium]|jgi:ribosomal protein S18 acetylase RimI-like enzyme|nr:GNAT family N-acetyltransferase [Pseudonocardiaceae bacterium]